ncbi:hypothetical protein [Brevundimonas sp.]|uniref:hypothetical protein n=1 Tax=Brevundimonas sp. TaxID=1871086 RepID=UPI002D5C3991|nr:hypothetical protein [Brevundimonas sp.]HYC66664.1 hypothetical protein [Brevundimonas sp.]
MTAREQYLIERIDRSKEAPASKAARSARAMFLRMTARQTVKAMLTELDPQERAAILCDTLDMVAENLHPIIGRVEAMTAFNSRAADIGGPLKLNRAVAAARAEQLFAKPANENRPDDGGEG